MKIFATTPRLILREVIPIDEDGFFELDSDPEVHKYLGGKPIQTIDEARAVITLIRRQYEQNGIGRWAVVEKKSNSFIGWCGLKLERKELNELINFYDLGYRFIKKYWGMGYATEAAVATLQYGFEQMDLEEIYGRADCDNAASNHILQKLGLKYIKSGVIEEINHHWYKITKEEWQSNNNVTA